MKTMADKQWRALAQTGKRWLKWCGIGLAVAAVLVLAAKLTQSCAQQRKDELKIEETLNVLETVRLRGEMYVCTAWMEDCVVEHAKETRWLFMKKDHSCVQTLTQKCSYVLDLDKVVYEPSAESNVVTVRLPQVDYVASTQGSSFLSDDANFWATQKSGTNSMKQKVEQQIRERFDTAENRRKAMRYAEDAIGEILKKMGFQAEFVSPLEQRQE